MSRPRLCVLLLITITNPSGGGKGLSVNGCENIFMPSHFALARARPEKDATADHCGTSAANNTTMNPLAKPALTSDPAEWLGDAHPLVAQLGTTDGLRSVHQLAESLVARPITNPTALRGFLQAYQERILFPVELPAIRTAYDHVSRNELRELIAFDQTLVAEPALQNFAAASRRIGGEQLQKLRPLRDERVVQRYLAAVESGEANGWHTLVYGMTLVLYSLPLRQGLLGYAQQTTRGFIHAAAKARGWKESECAALFTEFCEPLLAECGELFSSQGCAEKH